jgi:hypothetical protein
MTTEQLTERVPVMMGASLVAELDAAAKFHGISRSELIRRKLEADESIQRDAARFQARTAPAIEERADTQPSLPQERVRIARPAQPRDPGLIRF